MQAVDPVFFLFKIVVKSLLSHFKPSQSSSVVAVCLVYTYPPFAFQPVCVFESKACHLYKQCRQIWVLIFPLLTHSGSPCLLAILRDTFTFNVFIDMVASVCAIPLFVFCVSSFCSCFSLMTLFYIR